MAQTQTSLPRVSAIFIRPDGGRAVVDGRPVQAGDAWDGIEVEAVEAGRVRIKHNGSPAELRLLGAPIRKDNEIQR